MLELFELIEPFEICRRSSHSWAIIDVVWVYGSSGNYTIYSHSSKDITGLCMDSSKEVFFHISLLIAKDIM